MCLSHDGSYLVTGGADGNMFVYKTDLPAASKYARSEQKTAGTQVNNSTTHIDILHAASKFVIS